MLHVKINNLDFFVVHLSPDDFRFRGKEADTILKRVNNALADKKDCIVLGDFNAKSPFDDDINRTRKLLLERDIADDSKSMRYKNLVNNYFDYSVIGKFLAAGLVDLCQLYVPAEKRHSYSSPILIPRYRKNMEEVIKRQHRLDYIFVNAGLAAQCTNATIDNGLETGTLSDHYPVIVDFKLSSY
jgi:endonuclease/exonuclease/phosphatase family metal-dependent hydrolase